LMIVRGKVLDRQTKAPIPWVLVTLDGYSTTTDDGGNYELKDIPAGDYVMRVRVIKYRPYSRPYSFPEERTYVVNIELEPAVL